MKIVRTTLDIADDVLSAAKLVGKRDGKTAGQVISELARKGLESTKDRTKDPEEEFLGFKPLPSRGVIVTSELIERLLDEDQVNNGRKEKE